MNINNEIFITGGTGFAGSFAVEELSQRGFPLRILVRRPPATNKINRNCYVQGNLNQLKRLDEISRSNAGIVHYACASLRGKDDPQVDIDAMEILLKNWEAGVFVFISSMDVYGMPNGRSVINEAHPLSGEMNPYAAGKIACEELLFQTAKRRGRNDFTIFRAPWIFAPSLASKNHIQSRFLKESANEILLPGGTQAEWEKYIDFWVDARDLAWLVGEALLNPLGGAGNVIGGQFNWHEFFSILKRAANLTVPITHRQAVGAYATELFGQTCVYSGNTVNQHFQFKPKHRLEETLFKAFQSQ